MLMKRIFSALISTFLILGAVAQEQELKVKIVDTDNVTTIINQVSSSSSSSCNTSDFPVYQGTTKRDVDFRDIKKVIVRHDKPAEDVNNYLTVELIQRNGESSVYEMIKNIRITGKSDEGDFSVKVIDVKTIEVLQ